MVRSVKPRIVTGLRDLGHVFRLRSLGAICNFEFNFLTLDQGFIAIARDGYNGQKYPALRAVQ